MVVLVLVLRQFCENHSMKEGIQFLSYFFVKKKYPLVVASGMLWTGQWMSE